MRFLDKEVEQSPTLREFKLIRRRIIEVAFLSYGLSVLSIYIVWGKVFYPHHVKLGILLYVISYLPLVYKAYLARKTLIAYDDYDYVYNFILRQRYYFTFGTGFILGVFISLLLIWV